MNEITVTHHEKWTQIELKRQRKVAMVGFECNPLNLFLIFSFLLKNEIET